MFVLFCVLVVGCGGDGGQAVIMMVMYAYAVFVVMFYKDDDFKPAGLWFTALYADVIRYLCSVYFLFFFVLLSLLLYLLAKLLTEADGKTIQYTCVIV